MREVTLGQSDLKVSQLAYGCMRISRTWDPAKITPEFVDQGVASLLAAYDAGYTLFDHADIYGRGECEKIHGIALERNPSLRASTIIATKCGIRFGGDPEPGSPHRYDFSKEHILWSAEQSLRRLKVDTIDVYQLHRPDILMNPDDVCEAFTQLYESGKVRWFGVSNFLPSFVSLLQSRLPYPLLVNQVEVHAGRLDCFVDGTLDQCIEKKMTPLSWSPLGGGWLGDSTTESVEDPVKLNVLAKLDAIREKYGISRTAMSLAWLLKHPSGIIPIVGSTNPSRIRDAVNSTEVNLTREEWYEIYVAARGVGLP